jgi:hypothetical protein
MKTTKTTGWTRGQRFAQNVARDCLRLARRWQDRGNTAAMQVAFDLAMHHRASRRTRTDWARA